MPSTTSRGNYYKKKSQKYFEDLGYETQITEFMCGKMIAPGKMIYCKRDVFSSDGISMNGKEIIFWNSKHIGTNGVTGQNENDIIRKGTKDFEKHKFPECVKRQLIVWKLRKKEPEIINLI